MTHIVPRNRDEMITFYRTHLPRWQMDPERIGLTVGQVAQIADLLAEAETAEREAAQARSAARCKTDQLNAKADSLRRNGAAAMATIRATARTGDEIEVYEQANIPMPRKPRPTPPPEPVTNLRAQPRADGPVSLTWEGSIAHGQTFEIYRAVDGQRFVLVGSGRFKRWTDTRVPVCAREISYRIVSQRGGRSSTEAAQTRVTFGTTTGQEPMLRSQMAA